MLYLSHNKINWLIHFSYNFEPEVYSTGSALAHWNAKKKIWLLGAVKGSNCEGNKWKTRGEGRLAAVKMGEISDTT